jgi:hypothetical protein
MLVAAETAIRLPDGMGRSPRGWSGTNAVGAQQPAGGLASGRDRRATAIAAYSSIGRLISNVPLATWLSM